MFVIETIGHWGDTVYIPKKVGKYTPYTKNINEAKLFSTIWKAKEYFDSCEEESKKELSIKEFLEK